jgi:exosortase
MSRPTEVAEVKDRLLNQHLAVWSTAALARRSPRLPLVSDVQRHVIFLALIAVSAILFGREIARLVGYSLDHESCSHILLIPFISAYLLYTERNRIFRSVRTSSIASIPILLLSALCFWGAESTAMGARNIALSCASMSLVLLIMAIFIACYGLAASRSAAFPLLFLLLMVPLPDAVLSRTIHLLQQGSADLCFAVFKALRVPVLREGFVFTLPNVQIEVAQQCSGIRSSIALFITCLLAGHLFLRTGWKAAVLVALSLPLALVKNAIRIVTLALLSVYVNPAFLSGSLHRDGGFLFFLLTLALLFPVFLGLERSEQRTPGSTQVGRVELDKEPAQS